MGGCRSDNDLVSSFMVSASATPYQKSALSRQIALTEVYEQVSANTEASFRMRLDWCTPKKNLATPPR